MRVCRYLSFLLPMAGLVPGVANATITMVAPSAINPANVLCNDGVQTGFSVTCSAGATGVIFTTAGGVTALRSEGGQAVVTGGLDLSTSNPTDTLNLSNVLIKGAEGATFETIEFNLQPSSAVVYFMVTDNSGQLFKFVNGGAGYALDNGLSRFAFQGIWGETVASVSIATTGLGIGSVNQVRVGNDAVIITPPVPVGSVPEPASWTLMLTGFGLIGFVLRRRPKGGTGLNQAAA